MNLPRRTILQAIAAAPLCSLIGCQKPPETPLAHLYGQGWVHGAYQHYAQSYRTVQSKAETQSHLAYRVLAQKGITALDALQTREVPFYVRVDEPSQAFAIERQVPERLTYTAEMTESDRTAAMAAWKKAREHVHTDYEEIRRLNWSLTTLLKEVQKVRVASEEAQKEQYRLVLQKTTLAEGKLPFELPYQVTSKDYDRVVLLLLDRLEQDQKRLSQIESSIITVGLTVRTTDAGSASLAASIQKVLLAVVQESDAYKAPATEYPSSQDSLEASMASGTQIYQRILTSPEYALWLKEERNRQQEQLGVFLSVLDQVTGLPASRIYRQAMELWSGQADYLTYIKLAVSLVPAGGAIGKVLDEAIDTTQKVRKTAGTLQAVSQAAQSTSTHELAQGLVNTGSEFARKRLERQLVFYQNRSEVKQVQQALAATSLLTQAMPDIAPVQ